jgi:hypothetical protein
MRLPGVMLVELLVALLLLIASIAASDWCDPSGAASRLSLQLLQVLQQMTGGTDSNALQAAIFILWPQEGRGQAGISYEC